MRKKKTQIYVMTHKPFDVPKDPVYLPIHVGRKNFLAEHEGENSPLLSYTGDDTGDNISAQNCYFSELTGMYWVWKNTDADYVGICHYRRYLLNERGFMFTEAEIQELLKKYDVITTKKLQLNYPYYDGFAANHKIGYLDVTEEVIRELHPDYYNTYERLVHEPHTYFGNMLIVDKKIFDSYMQWLFSILFEVQKRVKVEEEDSYHQRIFGFISEFLQYVWITYEQLSVYECMVGMLGEKAEVTEVKHRLSDYFAQGDYEGAKEFFLEAKRLRPDLLMEASDVPGELHLCMEVIAIAGLEQQAYGTNLLEGIREFDALMRYCNRLNSYVVQETRGQVDANLKKWYDEQRVTEVAHQVAKAVMESIKGEERIPMRG